MSPAVVQHLPMIGAVPPSRPVQTAQNEPSNRVQSLDFEGWVEGARLACGLTHGQMCAFMCDDDGKPLDQSQWTRMRRDGIWPVARMQKLPPLFWQHIAIELATACGLRVSHADIADVAYERTAVAFEAVAEAFRHMRRTA